MQPTVTWNCAARHYDNNQYGLGFIKAYILALYDNLPYDMVPSQLNHYMTSDIGHISVGQ